jgi:outer membrane protein TolC
MELEAERNTAAAREGLAALVGLAGPEALSLAEVDLAPVQVPTGDADELIRQFQGGSPEIMLLDLEAGLDRSQARLERRKWLPDLLLLAFARYQASDVVFNTNSSGTVAYDPYNTAYAGAALGLKWSLDVISRVGLSRKSEALAGLKGAQADLFRKKTGLEIRDLTRRLDDQRALIEVTDRSRKAARSWLVDRSNLYDSGLVPVNDVLEALKEFYRRKQEHLQAVLDFNLTWFQIRKILSD